MKKIIVKQKQKWNKRNRYKNYVVQFIAYIYEVKAVMAILCSYSIDKFIIQKVPIYRKVEIIQNAMRDYMNHMKISLTIFKYDFRLSFWNKW